MNDLELNNLRVSLLKAAIDRVSEGNISEFGRRLGYKDGAFVRQMLNGSRVVSEKTIRAVEAIPGLRGWFNSASVSAAPSGTEHEAYKSDSANSDRNTPQVDSQPAEKGATLPTQIDAATLTSPARLKAALFQTAATSSELAGVAGVGVDVASQWLAGTGPELTISQAMAIQNTYGINMVWLTRGKGEPGVAVRFADEFRPIPITQWKPIPVVGMAQLGDNGHWADLEYPVGHGDGYVDFPTRDPHAYALKCDGDSMRPRIQAGEFVVIEPSQPVEAGDDVMLKSKDGRVMIKRFLYKRQGRTHVISVNDAHPAMSFTDDEIDKMHFVRAICRPSAWRPE
ncbi:S24 family peptidase [Caballeronia novacaledonica]|nr:S24 family peptidase [Caballeronia novacaledonica]